VDTDSENLLKRNLLNLENDSLISVDARLLKILAEHLLGWKVRILFPGRIIPFAKDFYEHESKSTPDSALATEKNIIINRKRHCSISFNQVRS
jgi:hypothetical protein